MAYSMVICSKSRFLEDFFTFYFLNFLGDCFFKKIFGLSVFFDKIVSYDLSFKVKSKIWFYLLFKRKLENFTKNVLAVQTTLE